MKFEYDKNKSIINKEKHGISLEEAKTIDEPRFMIIGKINGKFYSCIYTMRKEVIRLISARRSRKSEEEIYHENI